MNVSNVTHSFNPFKSQGHLVAAKIVLLMFGGLGAASNIFVIVLTVNFTAKKNLHYLIVNMAVADTLVVFVKTCFGVIRWFR